MCKILFTARKTIGSRYKLPSAAVSIFTGGRSAIIPRSFFWKADYTDAFSSLSAPNGVYCGFDSGSYPHVSDKHASQRGERQPDW